MSQGAELESIADELYGLPPVEFTATRDAHAAKARRSGDRELAAAIKGLKRPTSSAWLVNLLVRGQRQQIEELLDLGSAMRQAQEHLAGDELRELSQQRRQVISELGRAARGLAQDAGQPMSEAAERELESTLDAALADPTAGDEVRSGRLTTALKRSGLGSVDVTSAAAPPPGTGTRASNRPGRAARTNEHDDLQRRLQRREAAESAFLEAEAVATTARSEAAELGLRVSGAREEHGSLRQALRESEAQLERLRAEEAAAAARLREAERARETAGRSAKAAERRADQLRRNLDRLGD